MTIGTPAGKRAIAAAIVTAMALSAFGCASVQQPNAGQAATPSTASELANQTGSDGTTAGAATVPRGTITTAQITYAAQWRKVWTDHLMWSRARLVGIVDGSPDAQQAAWRLDKSANDMQSLLSPYYGADRAKRFADTLKTHDRLEAALLTTLKSGDTSGAVVAERKWYANGYSVTAWLAKAEPGIDQTTSAAVFKDELAATKQEVVDRLAKRYGADIVDFDRAERQTLLLADAISVAVVKRFPNKFR